MAGISMKTTSGGKISLGYVNDRFYGLQYFIEIDQSENIKNGQDSAAIIISHKEITELRDHLTNFLEALEKYKNEKKD
jgi:predicted AlkP superfamily pyrophosphatase or phosphodiesterase